MFCAHLIDGALVRSALSANEFRDLFMGDVTAEKKLIDQGGWRIYPLHHVEIGEGRQSAAMHAWPHQAERD